MFGLTKKKTINLRISGMHCAKCQKKVCDALNAIKGVSAKVDLENGAAEVVCPETLDASLLCDAVNALGFEASL